MSDEIIKVIDSLGQKFGIAIDWTSTNIVPYLQELAGRFIAYRNTIAIIQIVIAFTVLIIASICIKEMYKWSKTEDYKHDYDNEAVLVLVDITSAVAVIICIVLIIANCIGIAQNIFIPELTIMEYFQNLM